MNIHAMINTCEKRCHTMENNFQNICRMTVNITFKYWYVICNALFILMTLQNRALVK